MQSDSINAPTLHFIAAHRHDDVRKLALQSAKFPEVNMPFALTQIAGWQSAAQKLPSWHTHEGIIYPPHLALEQCSSEVTAQYKASLISGYSLVDLTGGFGIDCSFLAKNFQEVKYVERQEELCRIARHNFPVLGLKHIEVIQADSEMYLNDLPPVDAIFIDPARRDEKGGKTFRIADCTPNVEEMEEMLVKKAEKVLIKLSPMLDLTLALRTLKHTTQAHVVAVNNECKELLLLLERNTEGIDEADVPVHCVNFGNNSTSVFSCTANEEAEADVQFTDSVSQYLYEPNAALLKAGVFRLLSARYGLKKLHPNSHLYTGDALRVDFPGRIFHVKEHAAQLKPMLPRIKKANITVRNFPVSVAELRKRNKITDGGEVYLFATTLYNGDKVYIRCEKV